MPIGHTKEIAGKSLVGVRIDHEGSEDKGSAVTAKGHTATAAHATGMRRSRETAGPPPVSSRVEQPQLSELSVAQNQRDPTVRIIILLQIDPVRDARSRPRRCSGCR